MAGETRTRTGLVVPAGIQQKESREARPFEIANDIDTYRRENGVPISTMIGGCLLFAATALATMGKQFETFDERMTAVENSILTKEEKPDGVG